MEKLESIPVHQDLGEIKRRLHTEQCGDWPRVKTLIETAQPLIKPWATYKDSYIESKLDDAVNIDGIRLTSRVLRKQLDKVDRVFPYVISIGNQLEEKIRDCGDILDQYYLDTVGNVALSTVQKYLECKLMSKYANKWLVQYVPGISVRLAD